MIYAYWSIGKQIVENEQNGDFRGEYGKSILVDLSAKLTSEFGKGFSVRALQLMKKFYVAFHNANALRSQLTWTHYRILLRVEAKEKTSEIVPEQFIKDPYVLEFIDLKEYPALRETDLEKALIDNIQTFLLELGRGFCFVWQSSSRKTIQR